MCTKKAKIKILGNITCNTDTFKRWERLEKTWKTCPKTKKNALRRN